MNTRSRISRLVSLALFVLCVLCVIELGTFVVVHRSADVYPVGLALPVPSGYQVNLLHTEGGASACYVIRITADACPYCKRDQPQYRRLIEESRTVGCQTVDVAPQVGQVALRPNDPTVQLQFVDMRLGRSLNPYLTPQTIILDSGGYVQWQRQGSMDEEDLKSAVRILNKARKVAAIGQ